MSKEARIKKEEMFSKKYKVDSFKITGDWQREMDN